MPNLLAMSFEGPLTPAFDLHCLDPGHKPPDGWGIACYPDGEPAALVLSWCHDLTRHGGLSRALSDGIDLAVYADRRGNGPVFVCELLPPYGVGLALGGADLTVDLTRRGIHSRKGIVVSSELLS